MPWGGVEGRPAARFTRCLSGGLEALLGLVGASSHLSGTSQATQKDSGAKRSKGSPLYYWFRFRAERIELRNCDRRAEPSALRLPLPNALPRRRAPCGDALLEWPALAARSRRLPPAEVMRHRACGGGPHPTPMNSSPFVFPCLDPFSSCALPLSDTSVSPHKPSRLGPHASASAGPALSAQAARDAADMPPPAPRLRPPTVEGIAGWTPMTADDLQRCQAIFKKKASGCRGVGAITALSRRVCVAAATPHSGASCCAIRPCALQPAAA